MTGFEKLTKNIEEKDSRVVLGLDPTDELIDDIVKYGGLESYLKHIVDETHEYVVGIKPNLAFYEYSALSREVLKKVMIYASEKYGLVKILDVKRGDIMATQSQWARADKYNFIPDIVTLNPYMGGVDVVKPYLDLDENICVYILTATSNPGAKEFQDLLSNGVYNYQQMAVLARNWDRNRVGFVVGATKQQAITNIRAIEKEHDFEYDFAYVLAPGFGKQGADLDFVKYACDNTVYPISSGLTKKKYMNGLSYKEAAIKWRDSINEKLKAAIKPKSILEQLLDEMIKTNLILVSKEFKMHKWPLLKKGRQKLAANNISISNMENNEISNVIKQALSDGILDESDVSPVFLNIRDVMGSPLAKRLLAYMYAKKIKESGIEYDQIGSIAYGAIDQGSLVSYFLESPSFLLRKERGSEATHSDILGMVKSNDKAIMIEDVTTSAGSLIKDVEELRKNLGLIINDAFVFVKRTEQGEINCKQADINLHYIMDMKELIQYITSSDLVSDEVSDSILTWASNTKIL